MSILDRSKLTQTLTLTTEDVKRLIAADLGLVPSQIRLRVDGSNETDMRGESMGYNWRGITVTIFPGIATP